MATAFRFAHKWAAIADKAPSLRPAVPLLDDRDRELEDALNAYPLEAIFSHPDTPTAAVSPRWYPSRATRQLNVVVSLGTAGTSNTVITVYRNGVSVGTITLGSGATKATATLAATLAADSDYLTVAATTIGTGAKDVTVQARCT